MSYQATPFGGEWDENPENLLGWFLQCMGTADDEKKACHFVYYLRAGSDADEWFEELPEEEKRSWASIEVLFRRKWLKQEVIGTKEAETIENEPQVSSLSPKITRNPDFSMCEPSNSPMLSSTTSGVPMKAQTTITCEATILTPEKPEKPPEITQNQIIRPHKPSDTPTMLPTTSSVSTKFKATTVLSQSPASFENRKNSKIHPISEILSNFAVFSSPTSSVTSLESTTPSTTTTALKTRSMMADFTLKREKLENLSISTQTTLQAPSLSIVGPINDVTRVYTSPEPPNDADLWPPTLSSYASSLQPPSIGYQKSMLLHVVFELQRPAGSPASITIVMASKSRPASAGFMKKHQKVENLTIFTQKSLEPLFSTCFGLPTPSIAPTKHPCNLSDSFFSALSVFCLSYCSISSKFSHWPF